MSSYDMVLLIKAVWVARPSELGWPLSAKTRPSAEEGRHIHPGDAMKWKRNDRYPSRRSTRKFPTFDQSYRLLKRPTYTMSVTGRWRLLRSLTAREHLHFTRFWGRNRYGNAPPNYGPILRQRRLQLAIQLSKAGYLVHPTLLRMSLPKGASGFWLEQVCPWKGPVKVATG